MAREVYTLEFKVQPESCTNVLYMNDTYTGFCYLHGVDLDPSSRDANWPGFIKTVAHRVKANLFEGDFGPKEMDAHVTDTEPYTLTRVTGVQAASSGKPGVLGQWQNVGFNAGFEVYQVPESCSSSPFWFGWLDSRSYIEGFGTVKVTRARASDFSKNVPVEDQLAKELVTIIKERNIQVANLMREKAKGINVQDRALDQKKSLRLNFLTCAAPNVAIIRAKVYQNYQRNAQKDAVKILFEKHGLNASEYEMGASKAPAGSIDLIDLVYSARLSILGYLTSPFAFADFYAKIRQQQLLDPRWEELESHSDTIKPEDIPKDLVAKAYELYHLRSMSRFFDQRTMSENFGMSRVLAGRGTEDNAMLAPFWLNLLNDNKPIIVGNIELLLMASWYFGGDGCGDLVISYQGTTTFSDLETSFDGDLVPFNPLVDTVETVKGKDKVSYSSKEKSETPMVHYGYYMAFLSVRDKVGLGYQLVNFSLSREGGYQRWR